MSSFASLQLLLHKQLPSSTQTHHGQLINLKNAAHKDSTFSETTVFNVLLHFSGMLFKEDASHAHLITFITQHLRDVNAQSHVMLQDNTTLQPDNANVQLIKKEPKEFGVMLTNLVNAHQSSHCGMENTVSSVQLELIMMQKKNNVTIVLMDSLETLIPTIVSQVYDRKNDQFINIYFVILFF